MTKSLIDTELQNELNLLTSKLHCIQNVHAFSSIDSTNEQAMRSEKEGMINATAIIASHQTNGRGRLGRSWLTSSGDIAISLILRPPYLPKNLAILPMSIALGLLQALAMSKITARLKWPNDIIVLPKKPQTSLDYFKQHRKIGGILVENVYHHAGISASIAGMGLNLAKNHHLSTSVPHAMSLQEIDPSIERMKLIKDILSCLDARLISSYSCVSDEQIVDEYNEQCETLGRSIIAREHQPAIIGRAERVRADGSLLVCDGQKTYNIYAGDVSLI